jgi:hypothetical protein
VSKGEHQRGAVAERGAWIGASVLAVGMLGCSGLDPGTTTWNEYSNVTGPLTGAKWGCVEDPPPPPTPVPDTVLYTFPLVDWTNETLPLERRHVKVCGVPDVYCMAPIAEYDFMPEDREITVPIPGGADVYLDIVQLPLPPALEPDRVPTTLYFAGPLYRDQRGGRIPLLLINVLGGLGVGQGVTIDRMKGVVASRSHDCTGAVTDGAFFQLENGVNGIAYTVVNSLPTVSNPNTLTSITNLPSEDGNVPFAGFANVNTGSAVVRGLLEDQVTEFGETPFFIRPSTIAIVEVRPTSWL